MRREEIYLSVLDFISLFRRFSADASNAIFSLESYIYKFLLNPGQFLFVNKVTIENDGSPVRGIQSSIRLSDRKNVSRFTPEQESFNISCIVESQSIKKNNRLW